MYRKLINSKYKKNFFPALLLITVLFLSNTLGVRAQTESIIKSLLLNADEQGEVTCDGRMTFSIDPESPGKLIVMCDGEETGGIHLPDPTPTPDSDVLGNQNSGGLTGTYFHNKDFTDFALQRLDDTVDFNWEKGSPDPSMEVNTFSVIWNGYVHAPHSGEYTFYTQTDDGVRLWVADREIVSNWTDHATVEDSGSIELDEDTWYPITMQFYENNGYANARLYWSHAQISKEIIGSGHLAPEDFLFEADPTPSPTSIPSSTPTPTQGGNQDIFGSVSDSILGSCTRDVHDQYVTNGPDGNVYRTWHPVFDSSGCSFGHDHGDDPRLSEVDSTLPAFGFIGRQIGKDEPHFGFKVSVVNKGDINDEGSSSLVSSRIVFHMTTAVPGRYTARFHSMEYKMVDGNGRAMSIQGMSDTGSVGTICDNPRQARTVMGFGCLLDSPYEIWEATLRINDNGNNLATGVASFAAFDPISVMDSSDLSRRVYVWEDEAQKVFRFNNDRSGYRSCNRETYFGPAYWNSVSEKVLYTDAYGNVSEDGVLRQEIAGQATDFSNGLGFVATYKSGNQSEPQTQYKLPTNYCGPSLGILN